MFQPNGELEKKPVWYVMDDFGSRVRHSSAPNVRIVPLMFMPQNCAYSVMFLTKPVESDEEITRDWAANIITAQNPDWRKYMEHPWAPQDFSKDPVIPPAPTMEYFTSGRNPDYLADDAEQETCRSALLTSAVGLKKRKIKVFADDIQLTKHIKRDIDYVENWKSADVIWMIKHFHDYK